MDKIYSRPRLNIPKVCLFKNKPNRENSYNKKIIKIIIVFIVAMVTILKTLESIDEIVVKQCKIQAKSIATRISNEQATNVMNKYKYEELFNVVKDSNRKCNNDKC